MNMKKAGKNEIWANNRAVEGSQFWIQTIVNGNLKCLEENKNLNELIGENISWKSPLRSEAYKEYQLKNYSDEYKEISDKFWTKTTGNHPVWDALGYGDSGTLYLVEAKSSLNEGSTKTSARDISREKILEVLKKVHRELGSLNEFDEKVWLNQQYQLTNRIAFFHNFNKAGVDTKLIYLNIVNDPTNPKEETSYKSKKEWKEHYDKISMKLFGKIHPIMSEILYYFEV